MIRRLAFLALALAAASCGTTTGPGGTPVGPGGGGIFAPSIRAAWNDNPEGNAWTAAGRAAIDAEGATLVAGTPKDVAAYCPRYATAEPGQRRDFWVVTLSQIAKLESGLNASAVNADGRRGLLQISPDAARRYGCAIASDNDLLDPSKNIACGAKILVQTSGTDGYVAGYNSGWRGASRYWTELRKPEDVADLQNVLNSQSYCPTPRT